MRIRALAVIVFAALAAGAWTAPLDGLFSAEVAAQVRADGGAKRTFRAGEGLQLFPSLPLRSSVVARVASLNPTVGVEMILSFKPSVGPPGGDRKAIYNALHAVSSLKGIDYFSASRGQMRTFFTDAAFVDPADHERTLPDPRLDAAPVDGLAERRTASLEDSTFGRYLINAIFESQPDYFLCRFENASTIRKLLIPIVQPGDLLSDIIVMPQEDSIVVYGFSCVRAPNLFGIVERRGAESFANRLVALLTWFQAEYKAAYAP